MSPQIEPWMLAALAGGLGTGLGFVVQRLVTARRMAAVHRGAYVEQLRHAAELHRQADRHTEAMSAQAAALTDQLTADHERELDEQLCEQARSLRQVHGEALAEQRKQAQARWDELMHAHQVLRLQAQQALQNATDQMAVLLTGRPAMPTLIVEAQPQPAVIEPSPETEATLAALRRELAATRADLEQARAACDQAGVHIAELTARLTEERQAAAERLAQEATLVDARHEAALLREQLDAVIVELSAAARARDAREAQRAQLALQLALAQDAREREGRIAAEQRAQLQQQLIQLKETARTATRLESERDELSEQLTASRRTTRAAVLAAQQREQRLAAELAELRARVQPEPAAA